MSSSRKKDADIHYVWNDDGRLSWIPLSTEEVPEDPYISSNVAHIPPPPDKKKYMAEVDEKAAEVISMRDEFAMKALESGTDPFSVDDPKKHKLAKEFLENKGKNIIVYGGTAINLNLPPEYKIYGENELPDYDVYSPDPFNLAVQMSEFLYSKGYKYTEVRSGIHGGTYKVYSNLWPVLDSTYMPRDIFDQINASSREIEGLNVAGPKFLVFNMKKEMAETYNQPDRWGKVAYREKLLEYTHPTKMDDYESYLVPFPTDGVSSSVLNLLKHVFEYGRTNKAIFYGPFAYNEYITAGKGDLFMKYDQHRFLLENADDHCKVLRAIIADLSDDAVTVDVVVEEYKALNKTSYTIFVAHYPLVIITNLDMCVSWKRTNIYIASIDYMKYELYHDAILGDKSKLAAIIYLQKIQERFYKDNNLTEFDKSLFGRFTGHCFGPYKNSLKAAIFTRMIDMMEGRKKIRVIKPKSNTITITGVKNTSIRIYPDDPTSEECKGKSNDDCIYPCYWNTRKGKCYDKPLGIFRPGENELEKIRPVSEGVYDLTTGEYQPFDWGESWQKNEEMDFSIPIKFKH
uniref:Putative poly(A) polymerase catalytic subunit n=1 Tax=Marseillevirus LCMAC101 TaxID=2506602 RepID=A0A481YRT0_9VIRU|nr:MAG: uncharacterized protein LCMAC101_05060 [Marseillevirus LCMAC101]